MFVYFLAFKINIYNIPSIKGVACTRNRCYIGLFFGKIILFGKVFHYFLC